MRIKSKFSMWLEACREQASSLHPRPRVIGVLDYYHPVLDSEIGEQIGCWRLPGERDAAYAHRLGIHISEKQNELEALMQRLLKFRR